MKIQSILAAGILVTCLACSTEDNNSESTEATQETEDLNSANPDGTDPAPGGDDTGNTTGGDTGDSGDSATPPPALVASDSSISTNEDEPVSAGVVMVDGSTAAIAGEPSNGTLTLDSTTGVWVYTPAADFNGSDSFAYKLVRGEESSANGTISVTVQAVNDAPVASDSSMALDEDTTFDGQLTATDVDGDTLTFAVASAPSNGSLNLNADGSFSYSPAANANGSDEWTYSVSDGTVTLDPVTVSVTINPVNDDPEASDLSFTIAEDAMAYQGTLPASDVDMDSLTFAITEGASLGTIVLLDANTGAFEYTPNANTNGADSFKFTAADADSTSNEITASITITPENDAPVADDQTVSVEAGLSAEIQLTGSDVDGDGLTYSIANAPSIGTASIDSATGIVTYEAAPTATGTDTLRFVVNDGALDSTEATLTINLDTMSFHGTWAVTNVMKNGTTSCDDFTFTITIESNEFTPGDRDYRCGSSLRSENETGPWPWNPITGALTDFFGTSYGTMTAGSLDVNYTTTFGSFTIHTEYSLIYNAGTGVYDLIDDEGTFTGTAVKVAE